MPLKEESPPAHMLAGKRTGELVMRNGEPTGLPVTGNPSADISFCAEVRSGWTNVVDQDEKGPLDQDARTQQRLRALEVGNLVRIDRSQKRREMGKGEVDFDEFLDDTPSSCLQVPVVKVLQWLPKIGRDYARKIVADIDGLTTDTRMSELLPAQKYALSAHISEKTYRRGRRETALSDDELREQLWAV